MTEFLGRLLKALLSSSRPEGKLKTMSTRVWKSAALSPSFYEFYESGASVYVEESVP